MIRRLYFLLLELLPGLNESMCASSGPLCPQTYSLTFLALPCMMGDLTEFSQWELGRRCFPLSLPQAASPAFIPISSPFWKALSIAAPITAFSLCPFRGGLPHRPLSSFSAHHHLCCQSPSLNSLAGKCLRCFLFFWLDLWLVECVNV